MTTTNTMTGGPAALRLSSDRGITAASAGRFDAGTLATAAAFRTIAAYCVFYSSEPAEREVLDLERGLIGDRQAETAR